MRHYEECDGCERGREKRERKRVQKKKNTRKCIQEVSASKTRGRQTDQVRRRERRKEEKALGKGGEIE